MKQGIGVWKVSRAYRPVPKSRENYTAVSPLPDPLTSAELGLTHMRSFINPR